LQCDISLENQLVGATCITNSYVTQMFYVKDQRAVPLIVALINALHTGTEKHMDAGRLCQN